MANGYGKRPLWQWILIYAVVGIVVYGLIYYFVIAKRGSVYTPSPAPTPVTNSESSPSGEQTSQEDTIILSADGFSPATLTIKAGEEVTWINQSGEDATVNSDPHPAHSAYQPLNLGSFPNGGTLGGTLPLTFDKPGTYGYHNHLNPSQIGAIIVQ